MKSYQEAVDWLFSVRRLGQERTLEPVYKLIEALGNPHIKLRTIHVTGTNGKGSTSAMIASILRASGFKVGLFTSPHLERFTERIVVNGQEISENDVMRILNEIKPLVDELNEAPDHLHPLFFDIVTVMAFKYFVESEVDFAVLEVGMGGRLDATNIVQSLVSVITNISLEHTKVLGDTVQKIAYEKAGIIKPNSVLVTATNDENVYSLFKETAQKLNTKIFRVGTDITFKILEGDLRGQRIALKGLRDNYNLFIPLIGAHQCVNAATAVGAIEALRYHKIMVPKSAIIEGISNTKWPGRLEVIKNNPLVVLDCAKDIKAIKALKDWIEGVPHKKVIVVISISSDKNIRGMIENLLPVVDHFIVTSHSVMGRAADRRVIGNVISEMKKSWESIEKIDKAIDKALNLAEKEDLVLVTGSVFLVGEARKRWTGANSF